MIGTRTVAAGLALLSLATAPAHGAAGWFVGVGGGASSIDGLEDASAAELESAVGEGGIGVSITTVDTDDSDSGWRLFGGYRFNDYFAFETFYTDLGSFGIGFSGTAGKPATPAISGTSITVTLWPVAASSASIWATTASAAGAS